MSKFFLVIVNIVWTLGWFVIGLGLFRIHNETCPMHQSCLASLLLTIFFALISFVIAIWMPLYSIMALSR